jgi:hypothetical protein
MHLDIHVRITLPIVFVILELELDYAKKYCYE